MRCSFPNITMKKLIGIQSACQALTTFTYLCVIMLHTHGANTHITPSSNSNPKIQHQKTSDTILKYKSVIARPSSHIFGGLAPRRRRQSASAPGDLQKPPATNPQHRQPHHKYAKDITVVFGPASHKLMSCRGGHFTVLFDCLCKMLAAKC